MPVRLGQVQGCPHGRTRGVANEEPEMLRLPGRRASGCGLERDEDQCPNHGKGEQRRLDGVNEIHVTNFAGKVTPHALSQRTCSQSVGDAGLRFVGFSRLATGNGGSSIHSLHSRTACHIFAVHPERPCALPTDPSWGTVV